MRMTDCIYWHRQSGQKVKLSGVYCMVQRAIEADSAGHYSDGRMIVRIPDRRLGALPNCGDRICRSNDGIWYTVTEIWDNRRAGSGISHWKLVCRG